MSSLQTEDVAVLKEKIATSTRILVRERLIGPFGHPRPGSRAQIWWRCWAIPTTT